MAQFHPEFGEDSDHDADDEEECEDEGELAGSQMGSDTMRSIGDLYDLEDYPPGMLDAYAAGYMSPHTDREGLSESDIGSVFSPSASMTPNSQLALRLRAMGLADSEFSEHGFLDPEENSESLVSSSDFSNVNTVEDDDLGEHGFEDVQQPPVLPQVSEESLAQMWPLGDASFSIFLCPITHDVMTDPVVSADGYTYERSAISRWFETSRKSPVTGQQLPHTELVPNHSVRTLLKNLIEMTEAAGGRAADRGPVATSPSAPRGRPTPQGQAQGDHPRITTVLPAGPGRGLPSLGLPMTLRLGHESPEEVTPRDFESSSADLLALSPLVDESPGVFFSDAV